MTISFRVGLMSLVAVTFLSTPVLAEGSKL
ncbi:MAG TPA: ABC transporter substrate-binding protein, partial [Rhizobium sp.]|nr:ABC transporter substrate-binding protein [Rhizobium sp.]